MGKLATNPYPCLHEGCDEVSVGLTAMTLHQQTHTTVTLEPSPLYYFVKDGKVVGSALDLASMLELREVFPDAEPTFHTGWKKRQVREANARRAQAAGSGEDRVEQ